MAVSPAKPPAAVLFACDMNSVRSPMAAALMRHLFPNGVYVASAGVHHGQVDGFVASVMDEIGIDMSAHRPATFEDLADTSFDLAITLAPGAHHWALELTRTQSMDVEYWPVPDPTLASGAREQRLDAYRGLRDALMRRLKTRFAWRLAPSG